MIIGAIVITIVVTLIILFNNERCPYCGGKLVDNDYDENIGKVIWTCKKCGEKWVLY